MRPQTTAVLIAAGTPVVATGSAIWVNIATAGQAQPWSWLTVGALTLVAIALGVAALRSGNSSLSADDASGIENYGQQSGNVGWKVTYNGTFNFPQKPPRSPDEP